MRWLDARLQAKFEIKTDVLGPEDGHKKEVRVLNRILRWGADGIEYEPDQKHAEQVRSAPINKHRVPVRKQLQASSLELVYWNFGWSEGGF